MPNGIKYSALDQQLALKRGNFWIGTGDVEKGPTSTTGYWNGITPSAGGYTIYLNKASNGPSIYCPANGSELVSQANLIYPGKNFSTTAEVFTWFAAQTDAMVFNIDYPAIVTNGLVLNLDAGFTPSYPTTGNTWLDLSINSNNGTLTNGPTFSSSNGGSIVFDGVDDYISNTYVPGTITSQSMSCWISKTNTQYSFILATDTNYFGFEIYPTTIYANIGVDLYGYVSYNTNGPQNLVFTYDGSQTGNSNRLKIYLNGTLQSSSYVGTIPSSTTVPGIVIGKRWWASKYSEGSISTLSIYNRSLTAAEVLQNFNAQKSRFGL